MMGGCWWWVVVGGVGDGGVGSVSEVGCSNGGFVVGGGAVVGVVVLSCSGGLNYNYDHLRMFYFIIVQSHPMQYMPDFISYAAIAAQSRSIHSYHKFCLTSRLLIDTWVGRGNLDSC